MKEGVFCVRPIVVPEQGVGHKIVTVSHVDDTLTRVFEIKCPKTPF